MPHQYKEKTMSKQFRIISLIILSSLALAACSGGGAVSATPTALPTVVANSNIVAEGRVVPADDVQLSFLTAGQVEEVLVKEGDIVKKGDVVARLNNKEQFEAAIAGSQAELVAAQQARQKLDDDQAQAQAAAADTLAATNKALKDAQYQLDNFTVPQNMKGMTPLEAIAKMKDALDIARDKFEPYRYFPSTDDTREDRKEDLDNAQSDYNTAIRWLQLDTAVKNAQTRLDQAMDDYNTLGEGPDPDLVAAADARQKAAATSLAAANANLDNMELKATIDGTVVKLDLVAGQTVTPGAPVMQVADLSQFYVETDDLTEIEVVDIAIGQKAEITADAIPGLVMNGSVDDISNVFEEKRGDVTYTVRLLIDNPDPRLRWGMTVVVSFAK
jgi:multidrug efflux pump subunit AcrA (membrane-fusion protein)